jgi:hypothetical protein
VRGYLGSIESERLELVVADAGALVADEEEDDQARNRKDVAPLEAEVFADATPGLLAAAAPTPSTIATSPTHPMYSATPGTRGRYVKFSHLLFDRHSTPTGRVRVFGDEGNHNPTGNVENDWAMSVRSCRCGSNKPHCRSFVGPRS